MSSKKGYEAKFKAEVAIAALKESESRVELSSRYKVPQTTIQEWEAKLRSEARELFIPNHEKNKKVKVLEEEVSSLHKMLGELMVENSFLKKKLKS